jgi:hypothetical protein
MVSPVQIELAIFAITLDARYPDGDIAMELKVKTNAFI